MTPLPSPWTVTSMGHSTANPAAADPARATVPPGPAEVLADVLAGNRRFVAGRPRHGHDIRAAAAASGDQQPSAFVLGCIDSRVPLEAVFDQNFGSICVCRSAGHVLDRAVLGSAQFAVSVLAVPLVMVLGHERCGAVKSTVEAMRTGRRPAGPLAYLVDEIAPAVAEAGGPEQPEIYSRALRRHVARTVEHLRREDSLAEPQAAGRVNIVGAIYDLDTGRVDLLG
jgi:carbonic anhydrase